MTCHHVPVIAIPIVDGRRRKAESCSATRLWRSGPENRPRPARPGLRHPRFVTGVWVAGDWRGRNVYKRENPLGPIALNLGLVAIRRTIRLCTANSCLFGSGSLRLHVNDLVVVDDVHQASIGHLEHSIGSHHTDITDDHLPNLLPMQQNFSFLSSRYRNIDCGTG
jgi:hypothetical protein